MTTLPSPKANNTKALPSRILTDLTSAICASILVAPVITIIDQSIIKRTHNPAPLREHLLTAARDGLRHPVRFVTSAPYVLITCLYAATYLTANLTDTLSSTMANAPPDTVYAGTTKFLATSGANMAMCLYKDARFAKLFGAGSAAPSKATTTTTATNLSDTVQPFQRSGSATSIRSYATVAASALASPSASATLSHAAASGPSCASSPTRGVPRTSLALFAVRDSMTVFASFNVPPLLGPVIGSPAAAQFLAPALVQFISTPLHLLGLDLYNRPKGCNAEICNGGLARSCRWACVRRDWLGAAFARIGRIVPAFGVGGVVNAGVRGRLMRGIEGGGAS